MIPAVGLLTQNQWAPAKLVESLNYCRSLFLRTATGNIDSAFLIDFFRPKDHRYCSYLPNLCICNTIIWRKYFGRYFRRKQQRFSPSLNFQTWPPTSHGPLIPVFGKGLSESTAWSKMLSQTYCWLGVTIKRDTRAVDTDLSILNFLETWRKSKFTLEFLDVTSKLPKYREMSARSIALRFLLLLDFWINRILFFPTNSCCAIVQMYSWKLPSVRH